MAKNNAIVIGSLSQIAARNNCSLAESFMSAEVILLTDMSGSMSTCDATGGLSRYQAAENDVIRLQEKYQGKVALISFSDTVQFCPGGKPIRFGGGTDMVKALEYVKIADDTGIKIILISDGLPNNKEATLKIAKTFKSKIDCIFIGSELDYEGGKAFLEKLATITGGKSVKSDSPGLLMPKVETLMLSS
jgi:Mg-chelatase subunit ChlD